MPQGACKALTGILEQLFDSGRRQELAELFDRYYQQNKTPLTLRDLISAAMLSCLERAVGLFVSVRIQARACYLGEAILAETAKPVVIEASTTPSGFMAIFSGYTIRLEYLGMAFTIAAWAGQNEVGKGDRPASFVSEMQYCSATCLRITREVATVNDMSLWLGHHYYILVAMLKGHASEQTWKCMGDLISYVLTFGIFQDSFNSTDAPFFLTQWRRKFFYDLYSKDKFLVSIIARPPRLLKMYSSVEKPLELSDKFLLGATELDAAARVTPDGWDSHKVISPASWIRMRSITGGIAERLLQFRFKPLTDGMATELKDMSWRNCRVWATIPEHLRYQPSLWAENPEVDACFMRKSVFLTFLHCDFLAWRILKKHDDESRLQLLKVAGDILELIQELGSFRRRHVSFHVRFAYTLLRDGLSPAIVLAKHVLDMARCGPHALALPADMDRARVVSQCCRTPHLAWEQVNS